MTDLQDATEDRGYQDRMAGLPMAESYTLSPRVANAYINGYRRACEEIAALTPKDQDQ